MTPLAPIQKIIKTDTTEGLTYLEAVFINTGTTVVVINNELILMPGDRISEGNPLNINRYRGLFNIRFEDDVTVLLDPYSKRRQRPGNRLLIRIVE